ncbi:uncharacterized protein L969DRAFT_53606 [Mixia osmundae IAM 14324]|uniref:Uncharacterized protein n=1 Tax=Mixia osmundae (strain CBS 9802 / IAM 14324 / JCM 22182 / KY 12970) TaxID=764103 RepID=G7DZF7_MIXOS|nr:uncharacterized protein L969DRAFT_53606 [Mixia osmundae IAM 14324]KEI37138.1 hypothetical protein L969DRAFT_53606 [Mixia osmundae IAM 14324]GAA95967.1 hypothetical protein E5Q_02625 [Mixia osmundae IAM 14324]
MHRGISSASRSRLVQGCNNRELWYKMMKDGLVSMTRERHHARINDWCYESSKDSVRRSQSRCVERVLHQRSHRMKDRPS